MPIGAISINKQTAGRFQHKKWLEAKGFVVEETTILKTKKGGDGTFEQRAYLVQVDGFIKDDIDLGDLEPAEAVAKFRSLTTDRPDGELWAITYSTKVRLPGMENFMKSIPLATKLGPASALMMKEHSGAEPAKAPKSTGFDWEVIAE